MDFSSADNKAADKPGGEGRRRGPRARQKPATKEGRSIRLATSAIFQVQIRGTTGTTRTKRRTTNEREKKN